MPDVTSAPPDRSPVRAAPVSCSHTGFGVLRVTGADAMTFLHGQLSSDVKALGAGDGQYWSYNSPKGRMLANGVLWRAPAERPGDGIVVLLAADLAETIRRRLAMFVLRAKVAIEDVTAQSTLIGIAGEGSDAAASAAFGVAPRPSCAVAIGEHGTVFALRDGRLVAFAPADDAPVLKAALARHTSAVDEATWRFHGIAAGVANITAVTSDLFVPQQANWDLVGGVNFQKGCYPGQEIVARMQYLGRLKERLFAFHCHALDVAPGARIYAQTFGADQACGTVVNAAPDQAGRCALLAVVQIEAVESGELHVGAPDGAVLTQRPLPYAVPTAAPRAPRPQVG
ncbi:MAG: YgfZ/GcvT domain-containing protein [Rudaea sp.]